MHGRKEMFRDGETVVSEVHLLTLLGPVRRKFSCFGQFAPALTQLSNPVIENVFLQNFQNIQLRYYCLSACSRSCFRASAASQRRRNFVDSEWEPCRIKRENAI